MFSEAIYGFGGGILGRKTASLSFYSGGGALSFLFGASGFFLTLFYGIVTNVVYAWAFNIPLGIALITGVPFALVHQLSNTVLFGICAVPPNHHAGKIYRR